MSTFYYNTIIVVGYGDDGALLTAHQEAVRCFGDRVSPILNPADAHIGHASFFVCPSGRKNHEDAELRTYSAWIRHIDTGLDFVRLRFGEGGEAQVLDRHDVTVNELRCEHCGSIAVMRDAQLRRGDARIYQKDTYRLFCLDCQKYGSQTYPTREGPRSEPDAVKVALAQALNTFIQSADGSATGTEMVLKTETGERIAVSMTWRRV